MLSEKEAIENLKEIINLSKEEIKNNNENVSAVLDLYDLKYLYIVLNIIDRLQKENEDLKREKEENKYIIGMANNEMLGYIQGYLDGKSQKSSATEIIVQNRQNYIHKQEIELLQKKIEKYKYLYQKALDNTVSGDKENIELKKQLDLMAEFINKQDIDEEICKNNISDLCDEYGTGINCIKCIKQYFENKVKGENK